MINDIYTDRMQDVARKAGYWSVFDHIIKSLDAPTEWVTRSGKLTTRVSKTIHQLYNVKVPNESLSLFGETIRRHMQEQSELYIDLTNDLEWRAGDFGDGGSCFWRGRSDAKYMILSAGGFAVRAWEDETYSKGIARCWCIPYDSTYYIFNAYPKGWRLETFGYALITLLPDYKMSNVYITNNGTDEGTLFINSGHGIAVHPKGTKVYGIDFEIDDRNSYRCEECDTRISEDDTYTSPGDRILCEECFYEHYFYCDSCGEAISNDGRMEVIISTKDRWSNTRTYCRRCAERGGYHQCYDCDNWHKEVIEVDDEDFCEECYEKHFTTCEECYCDLSVENGYYRHSTDEGVYVGDRYLCKDCAAKEEREQESEE